MYQKVRHSLCMSGVLLVVQRLADVRCSEVGRLSCGLGMRRGLLARLEVFHQLLHMLAGTEKLRARHYCIK